MDIVEHLDRLGLVTANVSALRGARRSGDMRHLVTPLGGRFLTFLE